jgi:hypothetical protein
MGRRRRWQRAIKGWGGGGARATAGAESLAAWRRREGVVANLGLALIPYRMNSNA